MDFRMGTKKVRIRDRLLLDSYRDKNCVVCGRLGEAHHLITRASGGHDVDDNLLCLDREHHQEIHKIGVFKFCQKYPNVLEILKTKGFEFDLFNRLRAK